MNAQAGLQFRVNMGVVRRIPVRAFRFGRTVPYPPSLVLAHVAPKSRQWGVARSGTARA
ncbi:MAG: hypothetical protein MRY81_04830 [Donghicola eburneus]|nr:hypothetical protein [Donghicola eburneus]MCI5038990.1 hypothetical protein [Donghicola eburneus]